MPKLGRLSCSLSVCAALLSLPATPVSSQVTHTAICSLGFKVTFTTDLALTVDLGRSYTISSVSGTCFEGFLSGPVSFSTSTPGTGDAGCFATVLLDGSGTLALPAPVNNVTVAFQAVGPTFAESWTFASSSPLVAATGVFLWNEPELADCAAGSDTTLTLNGELVVAA
jgi:hypothetical protein